MGLLARLIRQANNSIKKQNAWNKKLGSRSKSELLENGLKSYHNLPVQKLVTQKAKGLWWLRMYGRLPGTEPPSLIKIFPYHELPDAKNWKRNKYFARPCPKVPRHGFVESRQVGNIEELWYLWNKTLDQDRDAELILMPKLSGRFSGVATNAGVSWALGNDGVTNSTSKTVSLPTPQVSGDKWNKALSYCFETSVSRAGINIAKHEVAYIEIVEERGNAILVQLRSGPEQPACVDYIPQTTIVSDVWQAKGDLIEWEKRLQTLRKDGVVVWDPLGSLASHYAVHAMTNRVPVVTSHMPAVGDTLHPSADITPPLTPEDYKAISDGILKWSRRNYIKQSDTQAGPIATAIATIQASPCWGNAPHLLEFRSNAIVTLARFLAAATLGECRHWWEAGPGRRGKEPKCLPFMAPEDRAKRHLQRHTVYRHALGINSLKKLDAVLNATLRDFETNGWGRYGDRHRDGNYEGPFSFGGPSWAMVSKAGVRLMQTIRAFRKTPSETTWNLVLQAANAAINTVHNGGKVFDKWIAGSDFRAISLSPAVGFANPYAAKLALGLDGLTLGGQR